MARTSYLATSNSPRAARNAQLVTSCEVRAASFKVTVRAHNLLCQVGVAALTACGLLVLVDLALFAARELRFIVHALPFTLPSPPSVPFL